MLDSLFNSSSATKILLFLFVNQTGYGSEIAHLLNTSLTPLQQVLKRLEEGAFIKSYYHKNKKFFELNSNHPLYHELESLLKKAYILLPAKEKSQLCFTHKPRLKITEEFERERFREKELELFFNRLKKVKGYTISAKMNQQHIAHTKQGKAEVIISNHHPNELIFTEKGSWQQENQPEMAFTNSFRWTLDKKQSLLSLEHLRYGFDKPVFLFYLTVNSSKCLESLHPHICSQDTYLGNIQWSSKEIEFQWRIIGPNKNDFLTYHYF